ncbi:CD1375 family protein [Tissierella praeacuta]|nr:CD1375 family protein [Tissierella praeacuta]
MAKIYVDLIRKGLRTIEQVPTTWREAVALEIE